MGGTCCSGEQTASDYQNMLEREREEENKLMEEKEEPLTEEKKAEIFSNWKKAIEDGNEKTAAEYWDNYKEINFLEYVFENGNNSLHVACTANQPKIVYFLLQQGFNVNAINKNTGNTALIIAVNNKNLKIIEVLLDYNANVSIKNNNNESALQIAEKYEDNKIYDVLIEQSNQIMTNKKQSIDIFRDNQKNENKKQLPILEGWLMKKGQSSVLKPLQKRWVVVKGSHILWSKTQQSIEDDSDPNERKKFSGELSLSSIKEVKTEQIGNALTIKANNPKKKDQIREYVFKATSTEIRDNWVKGINEYREQVRKDMEYLNKSE